jgi:GxxExxY protein
MKTKSLNDLSCEIIGAAFKVHKNLGAGLLESTYEVCLVHELSKLNLTVEQQKPLPVVYDGIKLNAGYRVDLIVDGRVIRGEKIVCVIYTLICVLRYVFPSGPRLNIRSRIERSLRNPNFPEKH